MEAKNLSLYFSEKNYYKYIIAITISAFVLRLVIAIGYYNKVDLMNYNISWLNSLGDGLFDVYQRNSSIDYPPVFLILLYPLAPLLNIDVVAGDNVLLMLILKIIPVIFDTMVIPLIWIVLRKRSPKAALFAAILWAVNISAAVNSSFWGQTDTIMAFLLILSFYCIENEHPFLGGIFFAICALTKFQALYFAPIILMELLMKYKWKKALISVGSGLLAGLIVFIPFMIGSKNLFLITDLYLGGFNKYSYATLNAFNMYGIIGLNAVPNTEYVVDGSYGIISDLFGWINIGVLGWIMLTVSVALLIFLYIKAKQRSIWVFSFLFMQCIFIMTTKMHERYQFIVLPLCLIAAFMHNDKRFFKSYFALTLITAINQFMVLLAYNGAKHNIWFLNLGNILTIFSIINVILFIYTVYISIKFCSKNSDKKAVKEGVTDQKPDTLISSEDTV